MSASFDDLERFVEAQAPVFDAVRAELQAGKKRTHWMWFVFPQLRGLGRTSTAQFYGIESAAEALRPTSDNLANAAKAPANLAGSYGASVLSIQQTGDAASATAAEEDCWGSGSVIDQFALSRIGGTWAVVRKTFAHAGGEMPG